MTGFAGVIIVLLNNSSQAVKVKEQKARNEAAGNLSENANAFSGLYEPLHMIKEGSLGEGAGVFADWDARVNNLENANWLLSFWSTLYENNEAWDTNEFAKKAEQLLDLVYSAGIVRSEETQVTVGKNTSKYYDSNDETEIEPGTTAVVDTPYWSINNFILEKGEISIS